MCMYMHMMCMCMHMMCMRMHMMCMGMHMMCMGMCMYHAHMCRPMLPACRPVCAGRLPPSVLGMEQDALWQHALGHDGAGAKRYAIPHQIARSTPQLLLQAAKRRTPPWHVSAQHACTPQLLQATKARILPWHGRWRGP